MAKNVLVNTNSDNEVIFGIQYAAPLTNSIIFRATRVSTDNIFQNELFHFINTKECVKIYLQPAAFTTPQRRLTRRPKTRLLRYLPFNRYYNYPHPGVTTAANCCAPGAFSPHPQGPLKKRLKKKKEEVKHPWTKSIHLSFFKTSVYD